MANVLDQQQTTIDNFFSLGNNSAQKQAQSFKPSVTAKISQVIIRPDIDGSPGDQVKVEVYSDSSGAPGTLLQAADSTIAADGTDKTFVFTNGPLLVANTTYWIVVTRSGALNDDDSYLIAASSQTPANPYANGTLLFYNGSSWGDCTEATTDKTGGCVVICCVVVCSEAIADKANTSLETRLTEDCKEAVTDKTVGDTVGLITNCGVIKEALATRTAGSTTVRVIFMS